MHFIFTAGSVWLLYGFCEWFWTDSASESITVIQSESPSSLSSGTFKYNNSTIAISCIRIFGAELHLIVKTVWWSVLWLQYWSQNPLKTSKRGGSQSRIVLRNVVSSLNWFSEKQSTHTSKKIIHSATIPLFPSGWPSKRAFRSAR